MRTLLSASQINGDNNGAKVQIASIYGRTDSLYRYTDCPNIH